MVALFPLPLESAIVRPIGDWPGAIHGVVRRAGSEWPTGADELQRAAADGGRCPRQRESRWSISGPGLAERAGAAETVLSVPAVAW